MLPIQIAGIAISGGILLSKYIRNSDIKVRKLRRPTIKKAELQNLQNLANQITSALAKPSYRAETPDYEKIISAYLPEEAVLVKPKLPENSRIIEQVDFDGDSVRELVATYRYEGNLNTIVLKKSGSRWLKSAEIIHENAGELNYRGFVSLLNNEKQNMLIGISEGEKFRIYAYSLWDGNVTELFSHPYDKFEIMGHAENTRLGIPVRFALWEKDEDGVFDVTFCQFNGRVFEEKKASPGYWQRRVLPNYVYHVKRNPASPEGWFRLSKALAKAGLNSDAKLAIETGRYFDTSGKYKEKFDMVRELIK